LRDLPLHHLPGVHDRAVFIDLRAVRPNVSRDERNVFLTDDLGLQVPDVTDIFNEPSSQLLRVELATLDLHADVLERLAAGVPWSAFGGAPVYGWAPSDTVTSLRISGYPRFYPLDLLRNHFAQMGRVTHLARGKDSFWSAAATGVVHLSIGTNPGTVLPAFIDFSDGTAVGERMFVHTDNTRRRCSKCGGTDHGTQFCRSVGRAAAASAALWSIMEVPEEFRRRVDPPAPLVAPTVSNPLPLPVFRRPSPPRAPAPTTAGPKKDEGRPLKKKPPTLTRSSSFPMLLPPSQPPSLPLGQGDPTSQDTTMEDEPAALVSSLTSDDSPSRPPSRAASADFASTAETSAEEAEFQVVGRGRKRGRAKTAALPAKRAAEGRQASPASQHISDSSQDGGTTQ
jgi:hypothetical protein